MRGIRCHEALSARAGPHPDPARGPAGHGPAHHPPSSTGVRGPLRRGAPGPAAVVPVPERGPDVRRIWHRGHGGGRGEYPLVLPVDVPCGKSVDPAAVSAALQSQPGIKAVFATHSETSTGAVHDIQALAAIVRETPALLVVDAITSLGVMDLPMDAWGVDILVAGSQKALMLPPGLAFAALSDRAWA